MQNQHVRPEGGSRAPGVYWRGSDHSAHLLVAASRIGIELASTGCQIRRLPSRCVWPRLL